MGFSIFTPFDLRLWKAVDESEESEIIKRNYDLQKQYPEMQEHCDDLQRKGNFVAQFIDFGKNVGCIWYEKRQPRIIFSERRM